MACCSGRAVFAVSSTAPVTHPLVASPGLYPTPFEPPSLGLQCFYVYVYTSGWHCSHWDLVTDCSPETTQTCRKNKAIGFVFPSILFSKQGSDLSASVIFTCPLLWIYICMVWLGYFGYTFGVLKKSFSISCFLLIDLFTAFLWFCHFSSPYEFTRSLRG